MYQMKCNLKGITIEYDVIGEGKPVIMLHGWPLDHRIMTRNFEPIFENRDGWKRIYPDLPGMGRTPGVDWVSSQDQILEVMLDFIANVAPGQSVSIAGFSYGGYLARGVVHRRAAVVDGLCLIAPIVLSHHDERTLPDHISLLEDQALVATLDENIAAAFQGFAVVQSRELLDSMLAVGGPAREIADYDFLSRLEKNFAFSFEVDQLPEPFGGPTLFFMGRQDASCGYRDAWSLIENFPRGTFVVMDRAGHGLMVEQKSLFENLVKEWLDRVEEYSTGVS